MSNQHPRYLTVVLVALLMLASFLVGYQVNGGRFSNAASVWASLTIPGVSGKTVDTSVSLKPVELFNEVLSKLQTEYVEPIPEPQELTYAAIRGMLLQLNDPYTRFMDPKEYEEFLNENAGHFAGIGATLNMTEVPAVEPKKEGATTAPIVCPVCGTNLSELKYYRVTIVEPLPGSPAKEAGLKPGDFILKVDKASTEGMTLGEVANRIRGPEGTKVTLTIARKGVEKPMEFTVTRATIELPAVESKVLPDKIGYLRLLKFNEKTVSETRDALEQFRGAGVKGIVLDLRNNPGGLLTECITVTSMFLPGEEKLIVSTKGRDGEHEYTRDSRQVTDLPLVVLVNKNSASASEILSGAIKDYKRGTLVGETTFGKAMVQSVLRLRDGAAMSVTTAHYYTPSGHDVGKKGIAPDVTVALDKNVTDLNENDNQAQSAIRVLKEQVGKK